MSQPFLAPQSAPSFHVVQRTLSLESEARVSFVDVTDDVVEIVSESGIRDGLVSLQTRHTTTAIVLNEDEPLLHDDIQWLMERWAPRWAGYRHDRMDRRRVNLQPEERPNGDSHARAMLLGASETLAVAGGRVQLGTWQRLFFVELDGERPREFIVTVMGSRG